MERERERERERATCNKSWRNLKRVLDPSSQKRVKKDTLLEAIK